MCSDQVITVTLSPGPHSTDMMMIRLAGYCTCTTVYSPKQQNSTEIQGISKNRRHPCNAIVIAASITVKLRVLSIVNLPKCSQFQWIILGHILIPCFQQASVMEISAASSTLDYWKRGIKILNDLHIGEILPVMP